MITKAIKDRYWDYFTNVKFKHYRGAGVTDKRLSKIKQAIYDWKFFWEDVVERHGGYEYPQYLEEDDEFTFNHCIGNFYGMVHEYLYKTGVIK